MSPISLLWILLYTPGAWCLRVVSLSVPGRVVVGGAARLSCRFDLEGDPLYSVRWYRDDVEFFRYVPKNSPPWQYLPMEGVQVDLQQSANATVVLRSVDASSAGRYKCEVSADAPSFQTESVHTYLNVADFYDTDSSWSIRPFTPLLLLLSFMSLFL